MTEWAEVFGQDVTTGTILSDVMQWRGGALHATIDIKVWPHGSAKTGDWPRGRRQSLTEGQFMNGDQLSPQLSPGPGYVQYIDDTGVE